MTASVPALVALVVLVVLAAVLVPARRRPAAGRVGTERAGVGRRRVRGLRGTRRPGRRSEDPSAWVAELAEVVAVGLRAGLDLPGAVRVAARSPVVTRSVPWLVEAVDRSADVDGLLAGLARREDLDARARRDLAVLARAWHLATSTGAAAASTTTAAAGAVRGRRAAGQRTRAALAGPRASMRLLTLLPIGGPVLGLLVGLDPFAMYASPAARSGALVGLVLTGLGSGWARLLLHRAARPATTGRPS